MTLLPPRVLSIRTVHTGPLFTVSVDRVRMPHGRDATMEVVRHRGSVVLLPMPDPAHVILVRQYRYPVDRWVWELPAGSLEPGEPPEAAARRECHEEVGHLPAIVERIGAFYPTPGYCDELMVFFRLRDLTIPAVAARQDDDEVLEPRCMAIEEVRHLVQTGEIVDMKTALGLSLI